MRQNPYIGTVNAWSSYARYLEDHADRLESSLREMVMILLKHKLPMLNECERKMISLAERRLDATQVQRKSFKAKAISIQSKVR